MAEVTHRLVEAAKSGTPWAVRELLDRCLGKPHVQIDVQADVAANRQLTETEQAEARRLADPLWQDDMRRAMAEPQADGYRRLTYMMIDADIVAVRPASVYRVLKAAGLLGRWNAKPSSKGTGFTQPIGRHEHWHIDVAYLNICGTFYYLCSILDGFSRYVVHWEIRESMTEADVEIILQRAREMFPDARPRIISDNGPQFIARDFKEFIRLCGMTHVRTSPYYPQSNGKLERYHRTIKADGIRPNTPLSLDDARRIVQTFVTEYNTLRLHRAIQYITPADKLAGRAETILAGRDAKLAAAREARKARRHQERIPA